MKKFIEKGGKGYIGFAIALLCCFGAIKLTHTYYPQFAPRGYAWCIAVAVLGSVMYSQRYKIVTTAEEKAPATMAAKPATKPATPKTTPAAKPSASSAAAVKPAPQPTSKPTAKVEAVAEEKPKKRAKNVPDINFSNIAGYESTKQHLRFVADMLATPSHFMEINRAKLPSGLLLYGPPGTGKTMFARALAGEAGVPFLSESASSFIEKYVGVGAQRVRELFEEARKQMPCIVFIDELDAVGRQRGDSTHDERQQTLNQLLVELSAIDNNHERILVIAATNARDSLDDALTRAGRFDTKIQIPNPNPDDRLAILKLHMKGRNIADDVDLDMLVAATNGKAGADIAALVNEAALEASMNKREYICQADFDSATFRTTAEGEKQDIMNEEEKKIVAYHEAGHALILKYVTKQRVPQVTIVSSTSGALGMTVNCADGNQSLISKRQTEAMIKALYGGRAAEEVLFGNKDDITNGGSDDLKRASRMIHTYLTTYGMSGDSLLDMTAFNGTNDADMAREAKVLAQRLYTETIETLREHREVLDRVAAALQEKMTLNEAELDALL